MQSQDAAGCPAPSGFIVDQSGFACLVDDNRLSASSDTTHDSVEAQSAANDAWMR